MGSPPSPGPSLARRLGLNYDLSPRFKHPDVARLLEGTDPNPDPARFQRRFMCLLPDYKELMAEIERHMKRAAKGAGHGADGSEETNEEEMHSGHDAEKGISEQGAMMSSWPQYPRYKPPMTWAQPGPRPSDLAPQQLLVWGRDPVPPGLKWLLEDN